MKVPINQKFMLTITEASEYFGIGEKVLRKFAVDHQEISIRYGNRWRIIRKKWRTIWQGLVLERNAGKGKYESEVILSWHLFTVPYKRTSGKWNDLIKLDNPVLCPIRIETHTDLLLMAV